MKLGTEIKLHAMANITVVSFGNISFCNVCRNEELIQVLYLLQLCIKLLKSYM